MHLVVNGQSLLVSYKYTQRANIHQKEKGKYSSNGIKMICTIKSTAALGNINDNGNG